MTWFPWTVLITEQGSSEICELLNSLKYKREVRVIWCNKLMKGKYIYVTQEQTHSVLIL